MQLVYCMKDDEEEHGKMWNMYILHHNTMYTGYFSHILHLDIIKGKWNELYGFQWR